MPFRMPAGFFEIRTLGKKIQLPINKLSLRVRVVYHMGRKEKFQYIKIRSKATKSA